MRIQDRPSNSFFRKITQHLLARARSWLAFLYPPIPPQMEMSEESDAKLPGLSTSLWLYQKRVFEAGMAVTFGGSLVTAYLSWIWPFLIGSAINIIFILILLRYRSLFQAQYPIIAHQCTKNILWLVLLEAFIIGALAFWIFADHQVVRWYL